MERAEVEYYNKSTAEVKTGDGFIVFKRGKIFGLISIADEKPLVVGISAAEDEQTLFEEFVECVAVRGDLTKIESLIAYDPEKREEIDKAVKQCLNLYKTK